VKNRGGVKNTGESFVKSVDCSVKNKEKVLIYTLNKTLPLFFTEARAAPTRYRIKATVNVKV